jgi:hypothetical protein
MKEGSKHSAIIQRNDIKVGIQNARVTTSAIDKAAAPYQLAVKVIKDAGSSLIKNLNERVHIRPFGILVRTYNLKFSVPN